MAAHNKPVRVLLESCINGDSAGLFILDDDSDGLHVTLKLHYPNGQIAARATDYFEAMCQIRTQLEAEGWRPVCYGSSRNVYPSSMARDMGLGRKAYKIQLGRPAFSTDLVSIFDVGPDVQPSSVEEQKRFWLQWLGSLGWEARGRLTLDAKGFNMRL